MNMIPRITIVIPRFPCSFLHAYAPRIIATEPDISGTMNKLRKALTNPKRAYVLVESFTGVYDLGDWDGVD